MTLKEEGKTELDEVSKTIIYGNGEQEGLADKIESPRTKKLVAEERKKLKRKKDKDLGK